MTGKVPFDAQLDAQLARGAARGIALWWVCFGDEITTDRGTTGIAIAFFAITGDPRTYLDHLSGNATHRVAGDRVLTNRGLVSAVMLDAVDDATLAAVLTLRRDTLYAIDPAWVDATLGVVSCVQGVDRARVHQALIADVCRDER
jgi:hypothetical protein